MKTIIIVRYKNAVSGDWEYFWSGKVNKMDELKKRNPCALKVAKEAVKTGERVEEGSWSAGVYPEYPPRNSLGGIVIVDTKTSKGFTLTGYMQSF